MKNHQAKRVSKEVTGLVPVTLLARLLAIDEQAGRPIYLQIADQLIRLIGDGKLRGGTRLPSTRKLAADLQLNRKTIVAAYEDAQDQGYLQSKIGSGVFVVDHFRKAISPTFSTTDLAHPEAGFLYDKPLGRVMVSTGDSLRLTEGAPDVRLANLDALYTGARQLFRRKAGKQLARYGDGQGDEILRQVLAEYLQTSRGIPAHADQLLITRGSQHAFQLCSRLLFRKGGLLAVAHLSYGAILRVAEDFGAEVLSIPLDEDGLLVEALANHPRLAEVRAVYLTPHHQYPTTVTLSAARRLELLDLAQAHGLAILEDDYDYDFNFAQGPLLPLAATDRYQSVVYLGSFTKVLAPTLRIGYMLGPPDFIAAALQHRLLTDRQGDLLLERAFAHYIKTGDLERHLRKVRPIYHQRRDHLMRLLRHQFGEKIQFTAPNGGMAIWAKFPLGPDYSTLLKRAKMHGLNLVVVPNWWRAGKGLRIGFASLNEEEQIIAINKLAACME